jgi:SAM-dependent methyltransferase
MYTIENNPNENLVLMGKKTGTLIPDEFELYYHHDYHYYFVKNYSTDYNILYDQNYYSGRGVDPLVDYIYEIENPKKTIRKYEFSAIVDLVSYLKPYNENSIWLDFGCGVGGLPKYVRENTKVKCYGFEEGDFSVSMSVKNQVEVLSHKDLPDFYGKVDIITSIEVLEHVAKPLDYVNTVSKLLKPGGLFFYTTGNAEKFKHKLLEWGYFIPEIHIVLHTPKSLQKILSACEIEWKEFDLKARYLFKDIIKYKVLKTLGLKKRSFVFDLLPWSILSHIINQKYGVTGLGYGIKK